MTNRNRADKKNRIAQRCIDRFFRELPDSELTDKPTPTRTEPITDTEIKALLSIYQDNSLSEELKDDILNLIVDKSYFRNTDNDYRIKRLAIKLVCKKQEDVLEYMGYREFNLPSLFGFKTAIPEAI